MAGLPLVGDEFAGYRVRAVLGRGGMSVVYQAENLRLSSVIALKVLAPELASDDVFRARFLEESRIAASLNHPNVIPIYDMGSQDDLLYIAMRYVSGTDQFKHTSKYTVDQMIQGMVTDDQAAGRVFCNYTQGLEYMVWTQNDGHLMGYVAGPVHTDVWNWWVAVHHNIGIGGSPMNMQMPGTSPSASASPSMSGMSPSMSASAGASHMNG